MNKFKVLGISLLLFVSSASAVELVKESQIIRIGTSSDGVTDDFFITMSDGVGPCANKHIIFRRADVPSDGFFNRLYSTALLAYSTGSKEVRVAGSSCSTATYIDLIK
jgi:hypothetical protein